MNNLDQRNTVSPPARRSFVLWVIAGLLAVNAVMLWLRPGGDGLLSTALAQTNAPASARGVTAFTGQLDHNRFGLFMVDADLGTVWCYEIDAAGGTKQLRLIAARSFIYDRYLMDYNCAAPNFRTVQELVARQRAEATNAAAERASREPPDTKTPPVIPPTTGDRP